MGLGMMAEREKKVIAFPSPSPMRVVKDSAAERAAESAKKRAGRKGAPAKHPARRATDFPSDSTAIAARNRPGDAVILARTGKTWREWFVLLNAAGAERSARKKVIAANTTAKPSWRDLVLIAYELEATKREQYSRPGGYEVSVSRTVNVPVAVLFANWADRSLRERWLGKRNLASRESVLNQSMEIGWEDGESWLSVRFKSLDAHRSRVAVKHHRLPQRQISNMKEFWRDALDELKSRVRTASSQALGG